MIKVDFSYNDHNYFVQCNYKDKMEEIINKFLEKSQKEKKNIFFLYNGQIINQELTFDQCANRLDKSRNYMNILVIESQLSNIDSNYLKKVNYIICPECFESAILTIDDFKFSITGCSGNHKTENLELKELNNKQFIDQSKIYCDNCHKYKNEINDFKLYVCNKCKKNLCPSCNESHDKSHKDCIKIYEENQFLCKDHYIEYSHYCTDCKKDLCPLCINTHENHNSIAYQTMKRDLDIIKDKELKDTKEKILELKEIIKRMIYQLNNLNKNLDIYFEIYDNILSSFSNEKINYNILQNINTMKKFNNNYLGNLSEIIKDNNTKSQFNNIIKLQTKIDFKNDQIIQINENINNNETIKDNNYSSNDNNVKNLNNILDDKYENFNINKIKELNSFTTKNTIEKLLILNDGRILTNQKYYDENGDNIYKLCVYSLQNGFICDINIDYGDIKKFYIMDDGNVILEDNNIRIIKINKNYIEDMFVFGKEGSSIKQLSKDKFIIDIKKLRDKPVYNKFFQVYVDYKWEKVIYKYDNNQLIFYKNIIIFE